MIKHAMLSPVKVESDGNSLWQICGIEAIFIQALRYSIKKKRTLRNLPKTKVCSQQLAANPDVAGALCTFFVKFLEKLAVYFY